MELSILLISYNTKKLTLKALDTILKSLSKATLKYEILIFDNHSTDGTLEAIKRLRDNHISLFESKSNLGFGKGNNFLAKKAIGRYLLLLNSDTEVLDNAIFKLLAFIKKNPQFTFVGGKLLNSDLTPQASCGPLYNPLVAFGALFCFFDRFKITRYSPNKIKAVGWLSGACILTSKSVYEQVRGFDERIFMYMEEIDLFKRAKDLGLRIGFYPEAQFIHHGFASSGNKSKPVVNVFKGYLYYYQKHYSKMANLYIRLLLKTKALLGYTLGTVINNDYLKKTYAEAYQITQSKI